MGSSRKVVAAAAVALMGWTVCQGTGTAVADPPAAPAPVDLWTVPTAPADSASLIVAYSFGNRIPAGVDATRVIGEPGPVNEALAAAVIAARGDRTVPVYAQTEIAEVLRTRYGLTDVVSIDPERNADGTLVYLSTDGVAAKVAELRGAAAASDTAAVVAFRDHLWRATRTTAKRGFQAFAPAGVTMPGEYDPQSGQLWTTSPVLYLPTDYAGRLALLK
ncbi:hypothetical protein [Nocardia acididurans]|nr:hypothetical protein [Nocardia acididurans]